MWIEMLGSIVDGLPDEYSIPLQLFAMLVSLRIIVALLGFTFGMIRPKW